MDLDAGVRRADRDGKGDPLQEREVDVGVEALRLEPGEAFGDGEKLLADCSQMFEPFLEPKSARLLEQSSLRKNVENFSYCLRKAFLK